MGGDGKSAATSDFCLEVPDVQGCTRCDQAATTRKHNLGRHCMGSAIVPQT